MQAKVEETQSILVKEVDELKQSIAATNLKILESEAKLGTKADQTEVDTLKYSKKDKPFRRLQT